MSKDEQTGIDLHDLLHPEEQRKFRRLCIETDASELAQLVDVVDMHLNHILSNAGAKADVETANLIADSIKKLLTQGIDFESNERFLIRGAVEYFLLTDDADGDLEDVLGFDDDARVLNAVLERISQPDFTVELPA